MSIMVFYMGHDNLPANIEFSQTELTPAIKATEELRRAGYRHVCMSTEFDNHVGKKGVAAVENGKTPDGEDYEWSKAARAGRPRKGDENKPVRNGRDL
jgi:hypothetical protein